MAAAETVWACRNPRLSRRGLPRRKIHKIAIMTKAASPNPTRGETTMGTTTFSTTPAH